MSKVAVQKGKVKADMKTSNVKSLSQNNSEAKKQNKMLRKGQLPKKAMPKK